jgi:alpha-mannosidase
MKTRCRLGAIAIAVFLAGVGARIQGGQVPAAGPASTLYIASNSHLDTQWNWTVQDTIRMYVPATFFENFKLFERYPDYVFNYEGAIHYMWFKEYYPEQWVTLRKYVGSGQWKLAGSWINAADPNVPSPEALMRQALYGKRFYRQQFGQASQDIYLPDCFGFGFALPSIGAHSGLKAFSTQKLAWGGAIPTPFAVGLWQGADGSSLVASIRGGDYVSAIRSDVSTDPKWNADLVDLGNGRKVGFRYFGVGDIGGAPDAQSVEWLLKAMANNEAPVRVRNTSADQLARDLADAERAALPLYEGELLLKTHGVGCYTSQAALKRWNRRNELLADAAERASVAADWLGGTAYPRDRLRTAWTRFLWHQFHDDLTGTSIPQAYQFSWNDQLVSLNEFASITTSAVGAVASGLDTRASGVPVVVYNPLALARRDPVEAIVQLGRAAPAAVHVVDLATGAQVPAQVLSSDGVSTKVLFIAELPSVSFKMFDVRRGAGTAPRKPSALRVTAGSLANARYAVKIDANGDVSSITDKDAGVELLRAPARLQLLDNRSNRWPAWEILWEESNKPPRAEVKSPVIRIVETGPARVALEVTRRAEGSTFVQRISLADGGDRLDFDTRVDWRTPGTLLKASFPLAAAASRATYDLGLGTIERPNAQPSLYEVPAQQWADITDGSGRHGAAIMNDGKYGWDKPSDNTLRLTLIHTPKPDKSFVYQNSNDIGRHQFTYAIAGHAGDWRSGQVPWRAARLNQPLMAFQARPHDGALGRVFSALTVDGPAGQVAVRAIKKAEDGNEVVIRVQELLGRQAGRVTIAMPGGIAAAREINAAEEPVGPIGLAGGRLVFDLNRYQPRTFAVTLGPSPERVEPPVSLPVDLPFNLDGVSSDADRQDGDFDGLGRTIPVELLPQAIDIDGLTFKLGSGAEGAKNIVVPKAQRFTLPAGGYDRLYLLVTAVGGDESAAISFERKGAPRQPASFTVPEWAGPIGQWDSRLGSDQLLREVVIPPIKNQSWTSEAIWQDLVVKVDAAGRLVGAERMKPGFVRRDEVAFVATHRHARDGNQPYVFCNVFKVGFDIPKGATAFVLPINDRIRILAMTIAKGTHDDTRPAGVLYAPELAAPKVGVRKAVGVKKDQQTDRT